MLRSDSTDARRARQRLAVGTCLVLVIAGLFTAIGLGMVFVVGAALFVTAVGGTAGIRLAERHRERMVRSARRCSLYTQRLFASLRLRMCAFASRVTAAVRTIEFSRMIRRQSDRVSRVAARCVASARRRIAVHGPRVRTSTRHIATAAAVRAARATAAVRKIDLARTRSPIDLQREALRLNAAGTNERRRGAYAEAVDVHSRALVLLREVDDPQTVALTQNNLALALSHLGDDTSAVSLFEQAAGTLRALGDSENEGKIMANLALAHRRNGRADEATNVLRLALSKLNRDSSTYELVKAELQRAS